MKEVVFQGKLDGAFDGFGDDKLFKTSNGQYWIQAKYKYWYHYKYRPDITIYKENGRYYISVEGKEIEVRKLNNVIESQIDGAFEGWNGERVYKLRNGQTWAQSAYKYEYKYEYSPNAIVYDGNSGTTMQVAGTSARVKRVY